LTNKDAIAIDQDSLGVQGVKYSEKDSIQVWIKPLQKGDWAVCFINRNNDAKTIQYNWANEMNNSATPDCSKNTYKLYNIWTHKPDGQTGKALTATLPAHGVLMYRLSK
jgi:alpha-galactosidase